MPAEGRPRTAALAVTRGPAQSRGERTATGGGSVGPVSQGRRICINLGGPTLALVLAFLATSRKKIPNEFLGAHSSRGPPRGGRWERRLLPLPRPAAPPPPQ